MMLFELIMFTLLLFACWTLERIAVRLEDLAGAVKRVADELDAP